MSLCIDTLEIIHSFIDNFSDYSAARLVNRAWNAAESRYANYIEFAQLNARRQSGVLRALTIVGDYDTIVDLKRLTHRDAAANTIRNLVVAGKVDAAKSLIAIFGELVMHSPILGKITDVLIHSGLNQIHVALAALATDASISELMTKISSGNLIHAAAKLGLAFVVDYIIEARSLSHMDIYELRDVRDGALETLKRCSNASYLARIRVISLPFGGYRRRL